MEYINTRAPALLAFFTGARQMYQVGPYGEGPSPIGTTHPPTSSAPLYRLNHSFGLVGGTGEPRELVRCVGQRARSTC